MFAAAAPALLEDGVKLHLAIHPALVRLLSTSLPGAGVWSAMNGADWPQPWRGAVGPIDFQAPIGALGRLRMPAGPPSPGVWLRPAAAIQEQWRQRFDALSPPRREEPRIGLAPWPLFGSAATATPPPAQAMDRLMGAWRARWHLLRDFRSDALAAAMRAEFVDLAPWISDAADLAGALASLDAVVTCDPLVALVGVGLGKPVFVLTSTPTDWRWGHADTSPFAPGARLYRQDRSGTWDAAIDRLTTDVA